MILYQFCSNVPKIVKFLFIVSELLLKMGDPSDWRSRETAQGAFVAQFRKQEDCDVTFQIGLRLVSAHKSFLQARSKVLRDILKNHDPMEGAIVIEHMSHRDFLTLMW